MAGAGNSDSGKDCAGVPFLCSVTPHGTRKVGCGTGGVRESHGKTMGLEVRRDGEGSSHSISKLIEGTFSSALELMGPRPSISCQLPINLN